MVIPVLATTVFLAACTTDPVPKDYAGPLAYIADSGANNGSASANFFYLYKVNGETIAESRTMSLKATNTYRMQVNILIRRVPAREATFTIVGRREYSAPIIAMVRKVYEVTGDELTLCWAEAGQPRPTGLKPQGSQWAERWKRERL